MQDRPVMVIFPSCPHCHKQDVAFYLSSSRKQPNDDVVFFFTCGNCWEGVCAVANTYSVNSYHSLDFAHFRRVYPQPAPMEAPPHTPQNVAVDYLEAIASLRHNNIKAACIMARSTIESAAVLKGAQSGGLNDKIKFLAANHTITQSLAEWANEIKEIGIDAAHAAERGTAPTKEDAADAISFAEMLLTCLFTLPGMIAERRRKSAE